MGCDIWLFAEKRTDNGWELMPAPLDGYSHAAEIEAREDGHPYDCPHPYRDDVNEWPPTSLMRPWFEDRYYYLFGLLAGVRSHDLEPIDDPRGIPSNASPEYRAEAESANGHSASYFTVREVRDHMATETIDLSFLHRFCTFLDELETYGAPDDIRIVFFFSD